MCNSSKCRSSLFFFNFFLFRQHQTLSSKAYKKLFRTFLNVSKVNYIKKCNCLINIPFLNVLVSFRKMVGTSCFVLIYFPVINRSFHYFILFKLISCNINVNVSFFFLCVYSRREYYGSFIDLVKKTKFQCFRRVCL